MTFSAYHLTRGSVEKTGYAYISLAIVAISILLYGTLPFFSAGGVALGYFGRIEFVFVNALPVSLGIIIIILGACLAILRPRIRRPDELKV